MTTYTDVFGNDTVPPSDNRYVAVTLTADTTFYWPEQASGSNLMADIMEVTPNAAWAMTFPDATVVSNGRDVLVRNLGAFTITLKDSAGGTIGTVAAGVAKYVYLTSNATAAGTWTIFTFGTGTSAADAAVLAGHGLVAQGSTLVENFSVVNSSITVTLDATARAKTRVFSGSGAVTCNLLSAVTAGDGFFTIISNQGSGSVTVDPFSSETIDGASTKALAPLESAILVSDGANWVTVGYGRSTQFQFTKLVFPISTGTPFTLTSAQAANKLIEFTGTLTAAATVNVPAIVAIYYVECSYSGAYTTTVKTAAGTGINLNAGDRSILYCDGTDVTSAQTASVAVSNISGGVAGALPYQTGVGLTGFSAAGSSGQLLVSGGVGAPTWTDSPTVTTINKLTITTPATAATLTIADGKTLTINRSLTLAGTDGTTMTFPGTSASVARTDAAQTFVGAQTIPTINLTGGQIVFPATQSASADANTLDDYEEGSWTPTLTFATPGDLSLTYSEQSGYYTKIGERVLLDFGVQTSSFSFTTSTGTLRIAGMPFAASSTGHGGGAAIRVMGVTSAGYTNFGVETVSSQTYLNGTRSGSGVSAGNITASTTPTGGTVQITASVSYRA